MLQKIRSFRILTKRNVADPLDESIEKILFKNFDQSYRVLKNTRTFLYRQMRVFEINAKKSKKDLQEICLLLFIFLRESIQSFTMNFSCRLLQWPVNSMARCTDRHRSLVVQTSNRDEISAVCVIYENRVFRKYRCLHGTRSSGDNRRNSTAVMQLDRRHHRHHCCQMKRIGLCRLKFLRRNLQFESVEF